MPILAFAGNDFAHELLYSISPSIAQKLKPINVSCEDNGIEMTVVAAEVNGEKQPFCCQCMIRLLKD